MVDERLHLALASSVHWYERIFAAHGIAWERRDACWLSQARVPPFHSNLVTLANGAPAAAAQHDALEELIDVVAADGWSVKDSFAALDLGGLGFAELFRATWLWREPSTPAPEADDDIVWSEVTTGAELAGWESAWSDHDANARPAATPRTFVPTLLDDPGLVFFAGRAGQRIVAVAAANATADAVGLSNVFARAGAPASPWPGAVAAVARRFPGLPIAGYERGPDLDAALALGFEALHPLTVWRTSSGTRARRG